MIADSLDYLTRVDTFYQNSFDTLFDTLTLLFGGAMILVGLIIPIIISYLQRRDFKEKIEDLKADFDSRINKANSDYDTKLATANQALDEKIRKAEIDLTAKINNETLELAKKLNKETGELNHIIQSVETSFNEKSSSLFTQLSSDVSKKTEDLKSIIDNKIESTKKEILDDYVKRLIPIQTQIEIFRGYSIYLLAKEHFENEDFKKAFELSIVAIGKLIQYESTLAEICAVLTEKAYKQMEHPNLIGYWTNTFAETSQQILKSIKNNDKFKVTQKVINEIRKSMASKFTQNN